MNFYLSGHHAFASGASSRVKLGIANAFARFGARAVAISRSPDRVAAAAAARRSAA